jgi:hypothetical protein
MAAEAFVNFTANTTLTETLSSIATEVDVADASGLAVGVAIRIVADVAGNPVEAADDELLLITNITSNTLTLTRARESTTAVARASGSHVFPVFTANQANNIATPPGGTSGQVLAKGSNDDYDTEWVAPDTGPQGDPGTDGNTVLYGTDAPTTEGVDGNFYIRTTTNFLYGPKASGVWPAGTSLVGPTGATGDTGAIGAAGANGDNAYVYIAYADADDGTGFTNTFSDTKDYIAILSTDTEIVTPVVGDFAGLWKNYKGAAGTNGTNGTDGNDGSDGQGVPAGGSTGTFLNKVSDTDYDTQWSQIDLSTNSVTGVLAGSHVLANDSFSNATGGLAPTPTFYAATVSSSYSKALAPTASVTDGTIISIRIVSFTAASLLTITPDGSDVIRHCGASLSSIVLARLDAELLLRKRGAGWDVIYIRGRQPQEIWVHTGNGQGSTATKIRRYTTQQINTGVAIAYADSSTNGASFTIYESGAYAIGRLDYSNAGTALGGVSRNASSLTTNYYSLAMSQRLPCEYFNNAPASSGVVRLSAGDIIRPHDDATLPNTTNTLNWFHIIKTGED